MASPWTLQGMFRIKGDPNMVQVQFGPFSRPLTEREYLVRRLEPEMEKLPWKSEHNDDARDRARIASRY